MLNRPRTTLVRLAFAASAAIGWVVATCLPVFAAEEGPPPTPDSISWIETTDSGGVSIWAYTELLIDRGGWLDPGVAVWGQLIDLAWAPYLVYMAWATFLIETTFSMSYLDLVAGPLSNMAAELQNLITGFGLTPALLTITAVFAVLWMARGRWVLGMFELFMALLVAALSVGLFANPVDLVAGPNGALHKSRDAGVEVALTVTGRAPDATSDKVFTQMVVDQMVRVPFQVFSFGKVIDGTACESTFNEAMKAYESIDAVRETIRDCDKAGPEFQSAMAEASDNPGIVTLMSQLMLSPAGFFMLIFALVLCVVVVAAVLYACWQAIKCIGALVVGLLPGGGRGSLWMAIAETLMSMLLIVFSIVFLAGYMLIVEAVLASGGMKSFALVDLVLVAGIVIFWKMRGRIKESAARMAQWMSNRPGAGATSLPQRRPLDWGKLHHKTELAKKAAPYAKTTVALTAAGVGAAAHGTAAVATGTGRATKAAGRRVMDPLDRVDQAHATTAAVSQWVGKQAPKMPPQDVVERLERRREEHAQKTAAHGKLVARAANAGLVVASGGSTTAVRVAAQAAKQSAKRAAVEKALARAAG